MFLSCHYSSSLSFFCWFYFYEEKRKSSVIKSFRFRIEENYRRASDSYRIYTIYIYVICSAWFIIIHSTRKPNESFSVKINDFFETIKQYGRSVTSYLLRQTLLLIIMASNRFYVTFYTLSLYANRQYISRVSIQRKIDVNASFSRCVMIPQSEKVRYFQMKYFVLAFFVSVMLWKSFFSNKSFLQLLFDKEATKNDKKSSRNI